MTTGEEAEHANLLRKAARTKLVLSTVALVLTWALWTTLQGGDQVVKELDQKYDVSLKDLASKWNIPFYIEYKTEPAIFEYLTKNAAAPLWVKDSGKINQFFSELKDKRVQYEREKQQAYLVKLRVPYLQDSVMINGLTLADLFPFVIISILSATVIMSMRERANAIILSWLGQNKDDLSAAQGVVIRADFKPGTLTEFQVPEGRWLVYRTPLIVDPGSVLTYSLLACTFYYVFYLQISHNPVISHEMKSTLVDYVAILWWFVVLAVILLCRTRKYYSASLKDFVGIPVRGRLRHSLLRFTDASTSRVLNISKRRGWLREIASTLRLLIPIAALSSLALPWMAMVFDAWRGYRFLLPQRPYPIDQTYQFSLPATLEPSIYLELRIQLIVAVLFIALCLVNCVPWKNGVRVWLMRILGVWRYLGIAILLLAGNLILHLVMLDISDSSFKYIQITGAPGDVTITNSLMFAEPLYGFWIFVALCFVLTVLPWYPARHAARMRSTGHGAEPKET